MQTRETGRPELIDCRRRRNRAGVRVEVVGSADTLVDDIFQACIAHDSLAVPLQRERLLANAHWDGKSVRAGGSVEGLVVVTRGDLDGARSREERDGEDDVGHGLPAIVTAAEGFSAGVVGVAHRGRVG